MTQTFGLTALRKAQIVFPGILMAIVVALAAKFISEHYGAPVMLTALLIGMAFNFLTEDECKCLAGIEFSAKARLRVGVALLGLGITLQQIAATGHEVLYITVGGVLLTIACGLALSRVLGRRVWFGLADRRCRYHLWRLCRPRHLVGAAQERGAGARYGLYRHRRYRAEHNRDDHLSHHRRLCRPVRDCHRRVPRCDDP